MASTAAKVRCKTSELNIGDTVEFTDKFPHLSGHRGTILKIVPHYHLGEPGYIISGKNPDTPYHNANGERFKLIAPPSKGSNMLQDIRSYVKENRQVLYTVAFIVALDHFVFNGAFRERLKGLVDGMLKKVEEKTK